MIKATGYAAQHSYSRLKSFEFERAEAGTHEIEIAVLFCGVCHSDIHQVKNEWSNTVYRRGAVDLRDQRLRAAAVADPFRRASDVRGAQPDRDRRLVADRHGRHFSSTARGRRALEGSRDH